MKRLGGHAAKDTKIGHMMEDVIIKTLVNETRTKGAAVTRKELKCAFKVGLIEHKTIQGLRCSPDALGIAVDTDGVERPICIEVKCRTRLSTSFQELASLPYHSLNEKYISVAAPSNELKVLCSRDSELIQLLHQCATLGIHDSVLVIGNSLGVLLKVIWVNFSDDLLSSFLECAKDTISASTGFVFEALRQKKTVDEVISTEQKAELLNTISKINDLSWPVLLHAIGFFNSLMNLDLPLKPSDKLLPKVCSLWNRLKNGSDVATKIIRSNWFPLPTTSRLPQGWVCHRILYLTLFQIIKIKTVFGYRFGEPIDTWRNRLNKRNGSFQKSVYSIALKVIIPRIKNISMSVPQGSAVPNSNSFPSTAQRANNSLEEQSPNDVNIQQPFSIISENDVRYSRRLSRHSSRTPPRKGVMINHVKQELVSTGFTPKRKRTVTNAHGRADPKLTAIQRVRQCRLPLGVHCLTGDNSDRKARNWVCKRCGSYTSFYCLGCHLYFCDSVVKNTISIEDKEGHFRNDHVFMKARVSPDGDENVKEKRFEATCFVIAHEHLYCS